jgi:hypothetical protein
LVLDVIFGKTNIPSHWVGGDVDASPVEKVLHRLTLFSDYQLDGQGYVVGNVRLLLTSVRPRIALS